MTPITLNTYAVCTKSPDGSPQVVAECHNWPTAKAIRAKYNSEYIARFGTARGPYIIAAPGEAVLPSR